MIRRRIVEGRGRRARPRVEALEGRRVFSVAVAATVPPIVQSSELWVQGNQVRGFIIEFNEPMAPGPAGDVRNYQVYSVSPVAPVPLAAAVYVPARHEVILVPARPTTVARYTAASGAAGHPSAVVNTLGQGISNAGTAYPTGVVFAGFPTSGSTPGIVLQARLAAQHKKQRLHDALNHIFNPFSFL